MASIACQLPARQPTTGNFCDKAGISRQTGREKNAPATEALQKELHQELKTLLTNQVADQLKQFSVQLANIYTKFDAMELKMCKSIASVNDALVMSLQNVTPRRQEHRSRGNSNLVRFDAPAEASSRRESRSTTMPSASAVAALARNHMPKAPVVNRPFGPCRSSSWKDGQAMCQIVPEDLAMGSVKSMQEMSNEDDEISLGRASFESRSPRPKRNSGARVYGSGGSGTFGNSGSGTFGSFILRRVSSGARLEVHTSKSLLGVHILRQGRWASKIWQFLEDADSSEYARMYGRLYAPVILISVFFTLLQTIEPPPIPLVPAEILELILDSMFFIELSIRFLACPSQRAFFHNPYNVIDILSVAPIPLRCSVAIAHPSENSSEELKFIRYVLLCWVPVFRLMKILRRFETFQLLLSSFRQVLEALPVLLFTQLLLTLVFSALIFAVEPRENIGSLPTAVWLTIVTMTTVGYGDITPKSPLGSVIVALLVIISVIFTAFPLGIIGSTFTAVWSDRDRILLLQHTRDCFDQRGYTAHDASKLFQLADKDGNAELDFEEFAGFLNHLRLGLKEERVFELFQAFDYDCSGTISHREFFRVLFPYERLKPVLSADELTCDEKVRTEEEDKQCPDSNVACRTEDNGSDVSSLGDV